MLVLCLSSLLLASACTSEEERADDLFAEATTVANEGNLEQGIAQFEQLIRDYPTTPAAARARKALESLRGVEHADERFPMRQAGDRLIRIARSLDRYRMRHRRFPEDLDPLVPSYLDEIPSDPWGRPFLYRVQAGGRGYRLWCYGADGAEGGQGNDEDIVIENGRFVSGRAAAVE